MTTEQFFIKPVNPDIRVLDPELLGIKELEWLAVAGEWKPKNKYWLRQQLAGDVEEVTPPAPPSSKK
jgi:hypothetical protein